MPRKVQQLTAENLPGPAERVGLEFDGPGNKSNGRWFRMNIPQIVGVLPAIVFPSATLLHLVRLVRKQTAASANALTWLLFGFANLAVYVYAERYGEWQAILGMLVTAAIDFAIVGLVWFSRLSKARA
jgi:hypothetical protein